MKPHRFVLVPLLFGLAFVMTGAAFLIHESTNSDIDPAWVSAGVCTVLGVVALVVTVLRSREAPASDADAIEEA